MINGDRFIIRDVSIWDAEWLFKITGDIDAVRYMGFPVHKTLRDTYDMLALYETAPTKFLAICERETPGELLGVMGYEVLGCQATLSVKLNLTDKRARGAGRLVCKPFVNALLDQPSIWRVWSFCHVDNAAGNRLHERTGATCEGVMKRYAMFPNVSDEPQDCRLYAITKDGR